MVPMMSVVPRCLWWSRVCVVPMVSVVYGTYGVCGAYDVCGALRWCLQCLWYMWWSMVYVVPTVSMVYVVPYGVCGTYGVCGALWCLWCLWWSMVPMVSVVVYGGYSVYDAYGHNEIVSIGMKWSCVPKHRVSVQP